MATKTAQKKGTRAPANLTTQRILGTMREKKYPPV